MKSNLDNLTKVSLLLLKADKLKKDSEEDALNCLYKTVKFIERLPKPYKRIAKEACKAFIQDNPKLFKLYTQNQPQT